MKEGKQTGVRGQNEPWMDEREYSYVVLLVTPVMISDMEAALW